ncbi:UxaA family hydrolase [Brevibacterium aurantiacum]|nr:UxaA family hydrolase [Brevibacterium aurantiacum]
MNIKFLPPDLGDNVAIATERIVAGEILDIEGTDIEVQTTVPKGHRFAVKHIGVDEAVRSWSYPFGYAVADISVGEYLCNAKMKKVLELRDPDEYQQGLTVNFSDRDTTVEQIVPEPDQYFPQRELLRDSKTFLGFHRSESRGWGTRNYVAVIGVTSLVRNLVLSSSAAIADDVKTGDNFHGIAPVVHTEAGSEGSFNNRNLVLRTLAGFAVNPNIAAAVYVTSEDSPISNEELHSALRELGDRYYSSTVRFFTAGINEAQDVEALKRIVNPLVAKAQRQVAGEAPMSALKLGLQCGGSDAFSGVTANPLLGAAVEKALARGGTANLAETDELIGAEEHVLAKVRDDTVVRSFLDKQNAFKAYARRHGQSAEGNVSGGNIYRGLYNITLKSLGAGRKRAHETVLDYVIGYGEPMDRPGYYFMDSPGNDLESIAGQVASGANVILFTTGNGSITNFPFVPTIKIVTTTERYSLLQSDMDFNAGSLMEGRPFDEAADELFELTLSVASGRLSKGELTGQSQVQVWRDWHVADENIPSTPRAVPQGRPALPLSDREHIEPVLKQDQTTIAILPTSLCSGQVAEQIAGRANERADGRWETIALPHTEGCGVSGGEAEDLFARTMVGYAVHQTLKHTIFLEHGCEKTHNDYFVDQLNKRGIDPSDFDWASIQRAGGIESVTSAVLSKIESHVNEEVSRNSPQSGEDKAPCCLRSIGMGSAAREITPGAARAFASGATAFLDRGIGVVLNEMDPLLQVPEFREPLNLESTDATLQYGQSIDHLGFHIMQTSTGDWSEAATGMGACGVDVFAVLAGLRPLSPHRFLPTVQFSESVDDTGTFDGVLTGNDGEGGDIILHRTIEAFSGTYLQKIGHRPNVGFQLSRGFTGVSL